MADELQCNESRCFVSAKLYASSPEASTRVVRFEAVPLRWTTMESSIGSCGFLSSWFQTDVCEAREDQARIKWGAVCGLAASFLISAGFWAGLGLLISRLV